MSVSSFCMTVKRKSLKYFYTVSEALNYISTHNKTLPHNCSAQPEVPSKAPTRPQNLLELQILKHHLRATKSETLGMESATHVLKKKKSSKVTDNTCCSVSPWANFKFTEPEDWIIRTLTRKS